METEKVTVSAGVPTVWFALLQYLEQHGLRFSTLERVVSGGSAVPRALIETFCDRYGISLGTFHNLVNSGAPRAVKIGASTRVLRDDEELWLQSLTAIEPSAAA
jgi:acyl-CoA synthetase (AMP-forming)/AMP-acid ligase II